MDVHLDQCVAITKAILELANMCGGSVSELPKWLLHRRVKNEENALIYHNRPLYVTVFVHDVELRGGLLDLASSLCHCLVLTLEAIGIPQEHVVAHSIEIYGFGGDESLTLGYISVDLKMGLFKKLLGFMFLMLVVIIICSSEDLESISTMACPPLTINVSKLYA